jgi:YHS domain-containing protein
MHLWCSPNIEALDGACIHIFGSAKRLIGCHSFLKLIIFCNSEEALSKREIPGKTGYFKSSSAQTGFKKPKQFVIHIKDMHREFSV